MLPRLLLFSALALFAWTPTMGAESLRETGNTRTLNSAEAARFGPKANGIRYDARMIRAAEIATQRAHKQTTWYCWRYVKDALLAANVISSRPETAWAKNAGEELCRRHGFIRLNVRDPRKAPIGAVIVYGGADAGHVELRTAQGYASDFVSRTPYPRPLVGIYVKQS
ncbi:MAG TPA: hypothetical protein VF614_03210 [Chthoniobacteraceae bacterium]|jgi:hypothetical protein